MREATVRNPHDPLFRETLFSHLIMHAGVTDPGYKRTPGYKRALGYKRDPGYRRWICSR